MPETVTKIKLRVGDDEFEAEGPAEDVRAMFQAWRAMLVGGAVARPDGSTDADAEAAAAALVDRRVAATTALSLPDHVVNRVFNLEPDNGPCLRLIPADKRRDRDSLLLLAYIHARMAPSPWVRASDLKWMMELSDLSPSRIDRVAHWDEREGLLVRTGEGKGSRYAITVGGVERAERLIRELAQKEATGGRT